MSVPAIDILLAVGEVPRLEDALAFAQMAKSLMGVHPGEATVEYGDTDAGAVNAFLTEKLSLHAKELVGEGGIDISGQ